MLILGLLFLAAAAVAAVELVIANDTAQVTFHMWSWTWHFDAFWLAVIGAAIITVAWLGLAMMRMGGTRAMRLRRERRELAKENAMLAQRARGVRTAPVAQPATVAPVTRTATDVPAGGSAAAMPAAAPGEVGRPAATAPAAATKRRRHFMRGVTST